MRHSSKKGSSGGGESPAENVVTISESKSIEEQGKDGGKRKRKMSMMSLWDGTDWVLNIFGALGGIMTGLILPSFALILGSLYNDFATATTTEETLAAGDKYGAIFAYVAAGALVAGTLQFCCFTVSAERQVLRIRELYLDAILKQEIAYFDTSSGGELTTRIAENIVLIRDSLGDKMGQMFQYGTTFVAGIIIGLVIDWTLTLVILSLGPVVFLAGYVSLTWTSKVAKQSMDEYSRAGQIAEEAFRSIRTVAAYSLEKRIESNYRDCVKVAEKSGELKSKIHGFGYGVTYFIMFCAYALGFWYGGVLVANSENAAALMYPPSNTGFCQNGTTVTPALAAEYGCVTGGYSENFILETNADVCRCSACQCGCQLTTCLSGGEVLSVFFGVLLGAFALAQASPAISSLIAGKAASRQIFDIIEREPKIILDGGSTLPVVKGEIKFSNVAFKYPSRDDVVFKGLDILAQPGESVALVGGSGAGKSTCTQLLLRFYDPDVGEITLDGVDLRKLNISWLRNQIGLVCQDPMLFATTIRQNILYGVAADGLDRTPSEEEIIAAAKAANAYDFITAFPDGFETFVGEGAVSLSGGQRQRIMIARAILRNPKILVLDEATSALDNQSERVVQVALDKLLEEKSRTTIVIAHRLSTVKNCDKIVVLGNGGVLEQGSHQQLLDNQSHYAALVAAAERSQEQRRESFHLENEEISDDKHLETIEEVDLSELIDTDRALSERFGSSVALKLQEEQGMSSKRKPRWWRRKKNREAKKNIKEEPPKGPEYKVSMGRIFEFSKEDRCLFGPAILGAMINGLSMPIFSLIFAGISTVFFLPTTTMQSQAVDQYAVYFVILAIVVGIAWLVQLMFFGLISERMTTRIRCALLGAILRQDIEFFEDKDNGVGSLTARLASDAAVVKAAITDRLALIVMNTFLIITAFVISFFFGWQLTLVLIAMLPLMIFTGFWQVKLMTRYAKEDDKAMTNANTLLSESINGIRTVTAFALRSKIMELYQNNLKGPFDLAKRKGWVGGLGFGASQAIIYILYAVAFYAGSRFIAYNGYSFEDLIRVFYAVVFMGVGLGSNASQAPDIGKAAHAVSKVFMVIDRKPNLNKNEDVKDFPAMNQDIRFDNVCFKYPNRDVQVLNDFTFTIPKGKTCAIVGESGSGKSTLVSELLRFYDPSSGTIYFHGVDTKTANVNLLRRRIGLVSQEPRLFTTTIFENIAMGLDDGEDDTFIQRERVIEAAKKANCHDFIMSFKDGYQTMVTNAKLSGGQRQRICIARCVIRDPDVFILDEATSSLDNESQRIVQESLDQLMEQSAKTTIVIAHRLSTIKNADIILVLDHGSLVEFGSHDQLIARNGAYAKLYSAQDNQS